MKKPYQNVEVLFDRFSDLYGNNVLGQKERYVKLFNEFKTRFNLNEAYFASSSGRVEICGNHTDHNGGKVISSAISLDILSCFLPTDDNIVSIISHGHKDVIVDLNGKIEYNKGNSKALVVGVVETIKKLGYRVGGFKAVMSSTVINGAGISSSAAYEVLLVEIINFLYNNGKITNEQKAIISQNAESIYFGKACGLLDQTAIAFGGLNLLDFSKVGKIGVKSIKNTLKDYSLILINSGGDHTDLTDEYVAIPSEMKSVAKFFKKDRLIEVKESDFYDSISKLSEKVSDRAILRAIHFYNENKRVETAYKALKKNDYKTFLTCINQSGLSSLNYLQNCYVCGSVNQPIVKALAISSNYILDGANRVHGGGFAGTTLNIVPKKYEKKFIDSMSNFYKKEDIIPLSVRKFGTIIL